MNIVVVDDEQLALNSFTKKLNELYGKENVNGFKSSLQALEYSKYNDVDIAFLDINMPDMNGIDLCKKLQKLNEHINIIFTSAYDEYAIDAYKLYASGYLLKPITKPMIKDTMRHLRYELKEKKIEIKCFGKFEIFVKGRPLDFKRNKCKELLAYLVSQRGKFSSIDEIISNIFDYTEDIRKQKKYFWAIHSQLRNELKEYGVEDLVIHGNANYAINTKMVDCDYYRYLDGKSSEKYSGEFMSQYSWAEYMNATLYKMD